MEVVDKRSIEGEKQDPVYVEINGLVAGFIPAHNRVLIKRLPPPPEGLIARPEIAMEQAERGVVIAVSSADTTLPPVGSIAKFSKYTEEIHFDDEGGDSYVIPYINDIRGWHVLLLLLMLSLCGSSFAQDKPNVTVQKMTDVEFQRLDDASAAMQKAAEAYKKAADEYASAKDHVLGKYNALESTDCHIQKIVDVRGQYIIVETRPKQVFSLGGNISWGSGCSITGGETYVINAAAGTVTN